MYVHSRNESINIDAITHIAWNHTIENHSGYETVVCISFESEETLYLYYKDEDDMKAI